MESTQYELDRTKQQKEELMKHYEQVNLLRKILKSIWNVISCPYNLFLLFCLVQVRLDL